MLSNTALIRAFSRIMQLSVNSTVRFAGDSSSRSNVLLINGTMLFETTCKYERLILILKSGRLFVHALHCAAASRNTHLPKGMMSPLCSNRGINSPGDTGPYFVHVQRASASAPTTCRVSTAICG